MFRSASATLQLPFTSILIFALGATPLTALSLFISASMPLPTFTLKTLTPG